MATRSQGTTLKITPEGGSQVTVGKLTTIGEIAPEAEEIDVTTLDSTGGYRQFMQGFRDSGELEISGFHDSGDAGQTAIRTAFSSGTVCAAEVKFPDNTAVTFSGFIKSYTVGSAEVDGAVGFGATIRITGSVTVTLPAAGGNAGGSGNGTST